MFKALNKINGSFKDARKGAEQFAAATAAIKKEAQSAGKAAEKSSKGFGKFGASIMRIAKYRVIRAVIRNIFDAFSEGLTNVREFSARLTGEGNRVAKAFDSMSAHTLKLKNQLGSAFAEILTSLMPIIERLIALLTRAADAIAQFFAALGGNTSYYRAVDASADMNENMQAGAGAAKEFRKQLMGFDEINRLDKPSNGGGSGGGNANQVGNMFEYVDLDAWTEKVAEFRDKVLEMWETIKTGVTNAWTFIKEHFDFGEFFNNLCEIIMGVVQFITGIFSGDWTTAFAGAARVVVGFNNIVIQLVGFVRAIYDSFFDWIINGVNNLFDWLESSTGDSFSAMRDALVGFALSLRQLFDGVFDAVKQVLNGISMFISGVFTMDIGKAMDGISTIISGAINAIISVVELNINMVIHAINSFLGFVQGIIGSLGGVFDKLTIPNISLPRFATGGFPEDGLFAANHGELVGQFSDGRTAVANNEQIIEGIKRGVFEAMTSAMGGNSGNGQTHTTEIDINGRQFFRAVWDDYKAVAREHGVTLVNM